MNKSSALAWAKEQLKNEGGDALKAHILEVGMRHEAEYVDHEGIKHEAYSKVEIIWKNQFGHVDRFYGWTLREAMESILGTFRNIKCGYCMGTGLFSRIWENGKPKNPGVCYRCQGAGVQTPHQQRRNQVYLKYAPVAEA
jgi:hypothetical protein